MRFDILTFSLEKIKKPLLRGYFFSKVDKKFLLQSHVGPMCCTKSLQKPHYFEAIYITVALITATNYPVPDIFLDFSSFLDLGLLFLVSLFVEIYL